MEILLNPPMACPIRVSFLLLACLQSALYTQVQAFYNCGGVQDRYVCDFSNPQSFHMCLGDDKHSFVCPGTLHFNAKTQICDWPGTTMCPYDNYSGQDGDDDNDVDNDDSYSGFDSNLNDNHHHVEAVAYQGLSLSSAAAGEAPPAAGPQVRINPYANLHAKKKLYHGYDDSESELETRSVSEETTQSKLHAPIYDNGNRNSQRRNKIVKGKRRKVFTHSYRNSAVVTQDVGTNEKENKNGDDDDVVRVHEMKMPQMQLGEIEGTAAIDSDNYDSDNYNYVRKPVRRTNNRKAFVHSYRNRNDPAHESVEEVDNVRDNNVMSQMDQINTQSQYYNDDHDNSPEDQNMENIEKADSFLVTNKLTKKGRKSTFIADGEQRFGDQTTDYVRHRPRSLSPYRPPSEAYNLYSHLKRGLSDNTIQKKRQALRKQRRRKKESTVSSKNLNQYWYQQNYKSKPVSNDLKKTHDLVVNNMDTPSNPSHVESRGTNNSEKRKQNGIKQKATSRWINSYMQNGNRFSLNSKGKQSDRNVGGDSDMRRSHGNGESRHSSVPRQQHTDDTRTFAQLMEKQKSQRSQNPYQRQRAFSWRNYRKDSENEPEPETETKTSWMPSKISSARKPVWHPRVLPYRQLPLSEYMKDTTSLASPKSIPKTNEGHPPTVPRRQQQKPLSRNMPISAISANYGNDALQKPVSQRKQAPSSRTMAIPAMSVMGNIIHPYRPKQYGSIDRGVRSPSKNSKTNYSNRKISSYSALLSKNNKKRGKCSSSWCQLPACRCVGSDIPGGLSRDETPMMVMLTFDDGVNSVNFPFYEQIFDGSLTNPNGCPVKSTFFVSGDSTDYTLVKRVTKAGHEIASHTLSHRTPTTWWSHAGVDNWEKEVVGMKNRLAEKSNVPRDSIQGMRAPFLQVGGDDQYIMLHNNKFRYDSSMVTGSLQNTNQPPIWPFTLDTPPDYKTCNLTPCPKKPYPGLWELPLIRWYGTNGVPCAMPDACYTGYGYKGTMTFLEDNFQRHYQSNRAPLGIFIHASWFKRKSENFEALRDFLSSILKRNGVWLLTASQVLDWMENPAPMSSLGRIDSWKC